jgi:capsular exopolysaccharide synthesis family protein
VPPNPPALLARKQMAALLAELKRRYEWVIVDSPPLASVTDAQLLGRYADSCIFVVQHDKVNKALVRRTIEALKRSGANVLGAVLNAVALKGGSYYYDYYYPNSEDTQDADDKKKRPSEAGRKSLARRLGLARR